MSLGVDTCWFGHYKLSELGRSLGGGLASPERIRESTLGYGYGKGVDVGERAVCCLACGYANTSSRRLVDVVAGKNGASRKPVRQLLEQPVDLAVLPPGICQALELARLAPSAANSQMWRFGIHDGGKTLTIAKPVGYRHFKWEHPDVDIGICCRASVAGTPRKRRASPGGGGPERGPCAVAL